MNRNSRFLQQEYIKTLFPVMISVLSGTVNTLIDSALIAQKLGADGMAAVNMCSPIYLFICTLGVLLAGGASLRSAQEAGKNQLEESSRYYHTAVSLCLLSGALFTFVGIVFGRPAAAFLAQGGSLTPYVYDYCMVTFLGLIPTAFAYLPLYYLQLEGKRREIMWMMGIVIAVDLVGDGLFLFVFDFGMAGAAAASVLSMAAGCIYGIISLISADPAYRFSRKKCSVKGWNEIFEYGSPPAVGNFLDAITRFVLNAVILYSGGAQAAAVWAVLNCFSELALSIVSGIPQTASPMISVLYTAKENSGIRILMKLQARTGCLLAAVYDLVLLAGCRQIGALFSIRESLFLPLLCLCVSTAADLVCSIWGNFFNVTDQILLSNLMNGARKMVFPVGLLLLLVFSGGYPWLFLPLTGICTLLAAWAVTGIRAGRGGKGGHALSRLLLLDDFLEKEGLVLDFSIEPTEEAICDASRKIQTFCAANQMDAKNTNRLGLAIEELMMVMKEKSSGTSVDLRAFALETQTGIRIRSAGKRYNPFDPEEDKNDDDFYMGIAMLKRMADEYIHTYTLGMNTVNLSFKREKMV